MSAPGSAGERSLARLLATLAPALDPRPYRFVWLEPADAAPLLSAAAAVVREPEGVTLVLADEPAGDPARDPGAAWARILLTVHSDLEAVGLLAAVTARLAARKIPVNAMAGWHHDHLYVPWKRRVEALEALQELERGAADG